MVQPILSRYEINFLTITLKISLKILIEFTPLVKKLKILMKKHQ
jgi:hypothetical protein